MNFKKQISCEDGTTIAAVETSAAANGRKWGIHKIIGLVKFSADVQYKSASTKGVDVLNSHQYDARSGVQTRRAEAVVAAWFADLAVPA